jgi:glycerophosphoryl diester phosphodiesterase
LIEVLHTFGAAIPFNLEIKKSAEGLYEGIEAQALEAVRRFDLLDQTLFSSFYDPVLAELRRLEGRARLGVLVSYKEPERIFERAEAVGAEAINPWFGRVDRALVAEAHSRGLAVFPYTVDEAQRMQQLLELGVDGLFTNHPDRMRSLLGQPDASLG